MRIASGNRMCSVASCKNSTSLSCKSLYCCLHMNSFVDAFVFSIYLGKKFHTHQCRKVRLFFCVIEKLEWNCSGKNLFSFVDATEEIKTWRASGLSFLCSWKSKPDCRTHLFYESVLCVRQHFPFCHKQLLSEVWTEITERNSLNGAYSICPT